MTKRRSILKQLTRNLSGIRDLLSVYTRFAHAQAKEEVDRAKVEKLAMDARIAAQREQLLANQVVLKDMEIDAMRHKLEQLGVQGYVKPFRSDQIE